MKKLVSLLLLSTAFVAGNVFAETVYISGKAVDQKIIDQTINQFKKSSPMAASQINNPQFKKQILQSIGMQQAILQEGNKEGLENSSQYQEKLQEVKPMIFAQILQDKASNNITDAEILAKYNKMKADSVNQQQYKVSHILVKDQKTADKVEAELKSNKKFADVAKKYSIDPGSKTKGGDLGWSDGSNYVPEFTAGIKTLKKGQYTTTPVKSQFGFHIIMLNDVKKGPATPLPPFEKMKDQIKQNLSMDNNKKFFDDVKAKYKIEVK
ncbi:MAG: peptidylprolyl isomerase [Burkholderiales bacterium]|nr:peptidylprolyl isomerase [Burkholderiales bacterium]